MRFRYILNSTPSGERARARYAQIIKQASEPLAWCALFAVGFAGLVFICAI